MAKGSRAVFGLIASCVLLSAPVWATSENAGIGAPCETLSPLFSAAGSKEVGRSMTTYVISAQNQEVGCKAIPLQMSVNGVPEGVSVKIVPSAGGASAVIQAMGGPGRDGTHDITYTVTDPYGNFNTVTLPLTIDGRIELPNATPILDPIGNKHVRAGQLLSFTIGASASFREADLAPSEETLVIDGLPAAARVTWLRLTRTRFAAKVELRPGPRDVGIYEVHVRAQDARGAFAVSQFRLVVNP